MLPFDPIDEPLLRILVERPQLFVDLASAERTGVFRHRVLPQSDEWVTMPPHYTSVI